MRRRSFLAGVALTALDSALPIRSESDVRSPNPRVLAGIDVLIRRRFAPLQGKRIGLVTNPTGVTRDLRATIDVLASAPGVRLVALFGPEHGVRGDAAAGESVATTRDPHTGLPVYSLYGNTHKPTPAMLRGIDSLVFDMQDIGSRSYTYITTLGYCMEAAAENGVPLVVLDRPNPIGGERVEGNILDMRFKSGVGPFPIAYCHGFTMGELAGMVNGRGWLPGGKQCSLVVVRMEGYRRAMRWDETGLPWVPTSPHVPHADTSYFYAATGIVGELPALSIGVGYTLPFEIAGAPGIDTSAMASEMNRRALPGVTFRPMSWRPFYANYQGKLCGGVQIHLTDPDRAPLTRINFELMDAVRKLAPSRSFFSGSPRMFDLECGTDQVRKMFQSGRSAAQIWAAWNAGSATFRAQRKPYLLYE